MKCKPKHSLALFSSTHLQRKTNPPILVRRKHMSFFNDLVAKRAVVQTAIDALVALAETDKRDFTETENDSFTASLAEAKAIDARIADLDAAEESRKAADAVAKRLLQMTSATIVSEPAVYREGGENSYFRDLALGTVRNDRDALDRLVRNGKMTNEARALTTTDGGAGDFVPPLYLTDKWVNLARAGRVVADSVTNEALPTGTDSISVPKITGGTSTGSQATQGTALSQTDLQSSTVTTPVVTIGGSQLISLQLLEQSPISFDKLIIGDLAASYAAQLDAQVIAGAGSSGTLKGLLAASGTNAVTFTSASPTVAALYSKVAGAIASIHTSRFLPPTHIFMHPRRWAFLLAASDSTGRPLVVPSTNAPMNSVGIAGAVASESFVGTFCGLPVYTDANIPANLGAGTNEDRVIIARASDSVLYEGTPKAEALPQTYGANLQVLIRMYNYAAFTAERMAQSVAIVSGTGLVTPTF